MRGILKNLNFYNNVYSCIFYTISKKILMNRRNFIKTTGITFTGTLIGYSLFSFSNDKNSTLIHFPDYVNAIINNQTVQLINKGKEVWTYKDIIVTLKESDNSIEVFIEAPKVKISSVTLSWNTPSKSNSKIMNDHWERTYGDISWHKSSSTELLPWYFMEYNNHDTFGFGVKTSGNTFCGWQINDTQLSLQIDTRSGGNGVELGNRKLSAASIVTIKNNLAETPFQTAKRFMSVMCTKARMPKEPVYGINDWYFSYGNNSEKLILEHTNLMAPMAEGLKNRPFSVIDAGWFQDSPHHKNDCCWGDNMHTKNSKFGDMGELAAKIKKAGMRPGIWTRPLCASYKDKKNVLLPFSSGNENNKPVLDPSIPENLERVKNYFKLYEKWGYEIVKFDFTTFDIFGKWGFEMLNTKSMTQDNWSMHDTTKTNAEIILNLYKAIREAAGDTYIIGCNTISHLSAGLFELNRIGDDTSGNEWDRTRKMGVNTLAFRGMQHGAFYSADGDCVGITPKVPWEKNKQWMELVAKSGTPLFISAQPEATGDQQKKDIAACFKLASQTLPVGEPLDWMENPFPEKWKLNGNIETFNW
jgi:alpha-galactosidase